MFPYFIVNYFSVFTAAIKFGHTLEVLDGLVRLIIQG